MDEHFSAELNVGIAKARRVREEEALIFEDVDQLVAGRTGSPKVFSCIRKHLRSIDRI